MEAGLPSASQPRQPVRRAAPAPRWCGGGMGATCRARRGLALERTARMTAQSAALHNCWVQAAALGEPDASACATACAYSAQGLVFAPVERLSITTSERPCGAVSDLDVRTSIACQACSCSGDSSGGRSRSRTSAVRVRCDSVKRTKPFSSNVLSGRAVVPVSSSRSRTNTPLPCDSNARSSFFCARDRRSRGSASLVEDRLSTHWSRSGGGLWGCNAARRCTAPSRSNLRCMRVKTVGPARCCSRSWETSPSVLQSLEEEALVPCGCRTFRQFYEWVQSRPVLHAFA